jgi:hypothetical protein
LQDENARLKKVVADLTLDKVMLQDVLSKNWDAPRGAVLESHVRTTLLVVPAPRLDFLQGTPNDFALHCREMMMSTTERSPEDSR